MLRTSNRPNDVPRSGYLTLDWVAPTVYHVKLLRGIVSLYSTLFLAHKLKMFTGPHREGPCGNPGKAPAFLSQRVRPAVSLGARSSAPT